MKNEGRTKGQAMEKQGRRKREGRGKDMLWFVYILLKQLHMALDCEGDFLLVSQFEDLPPDEARQLKDQFCFEEGRLEELLDVLAHWHVAPGFRERLEGLLTSRESDQAVQIVTA